MLLLQLKKKTQKFQIICVTQAVTQKVLDMEPATSTLTLTATIGLLSNIYLIL